MRRRSDTFSILALALPAASAILWAQSPPPSVPERAAEQPIIRTGTREVIVDVIVRDKRGRPVLDLKPEEIRIDDAGSAVEIKNLRLVKGTRPDGKADITRELRLVTMVFERMTLEGGRLAREAANELVQVASAQNLYQSVMMVQNRLVALQAYTNDKAKLKKAIDAATVGPKTSLAPMIQQTENAIRTEISGGAQQMTEFLRGDLTSVRGAPSSSSDPAAAGAAAATNGPLRQRMEIMLNMLEMSSQLAREVQGRPTLGALRAAVEQLAPLPGRKAIVYFSEGLQLTAATEQQYQNLIGAAAKANVSIYTVDASGLSVTARHVEALRQLGMAANASMETRTQGSDEKVTRNQVMAFDTALESIKSNTQSALNDMAIATGGLFIAESNDMRRPMQQLIEDVDTYYEAVFTPKIEQYDGSFRPLAVSVARANVKVQSRKGYFAVPPKIDGWEVAPFEMPILDATKPGMDAVGKPFGSRLIETGAIANGITVQAVAEIPLSELVIVENAATQTYQARVGMMAVVRNAKGEIVAKSSQDIVDQGPVEKLASLRKTSLTWRRTISVPEGSYRVSIGVFDRNANTIRTRHFDWTARRNAVELSDPFVVARIDPAAATLDPADPLRLESGTVVPLLAYSLPPKTPSVPIFLAMRGKPAMKPEVKMTVERDGVNVGEFPLTMSAYPASGLITNVATIPTDKVETGTYRFTFEAREGTASVKKTIEVHLTGEPAKTVAAAATETAGPEVAAGDGFRLPEGKDSLRELTKLSDEEQVSTVEAVRKRALEYVRGLPNLTCRLITKRMTDRRGTGEWQEIGTLEEMMTYIDGKERHAKVYASNPEAARSAGVDSRGEFGGIMEAIFDLKAAAEFKWEGWAEVDGAPVHVFDYQITQKTSTFVMNWNARPPLSWKPAFSGKVYADARTLEIRRITLKAGSAPPKFPFRSVAFDIRYDTAHIGDTDVVVPVAANVETQIGKRKLVRNDLAFRDYRKWGAETKLSFEKP